MTEKRRPTYDLAVFKAAFNEVGKLHVTGSALRSAASLGFGRTEIVTTIQTMRRDHFFKSMTAFADHRLWQDVYRPTTSAGRVYLKLTVTDDLLIVSFKEL